MVFAASGASLFIVALSPSRKIYHKGGCMNQTAGVCIVIACKRIEELEQQYSEVS
jgi:hypothetical protein